MAVKSKSSTPAAAPVDHPANDLSILNDDQIVSLAKLQPVHLPNTVQLETDVDHPIHQLRNSWKYVYVVNWIYNCRGFIRLQSEYFDIDLFETELLGMVQPPPLDETILFVNKLRVSLITSVQGSKCSLNNFENIFRIYFGSKTPLGGSEEDDEEEEVVAASGDGQTDNLKQENGAEVYAPRFDQLSIEDKFEVFYIMIDYITAFPQFRSWIDKNEISTDLLRINPFAVENNANGTSDSLVLLFDNTRVYKRTIKYPQLSIPKKRKLATSDPDTHYNASKFDIVSIKFDLITMGIYQFDKYTQELKTKVKRNSKFKQQLATLSSSSVTDTLFAAEIKKRKFITSRRKDLQLANLLATRKRSSRLEAKEKQRQEDLRLARLQEEEELRIAAEKRLERRRLARNEAQIGEGLTREERLRMRREPKEEEVSEVQSEVVPVENPIPELGDVQESEVVHLNGNGDNMQIDTNEQPNTPTFGDSKDIIEKTVLAINPNVQSTEPESPITVATEQPVVPEVVPEPEPSASAPPSVATIPSTQETTVTPTFPSGHEEKP